MAFSFHVPVQVFGGEGCVAANADVFASLGRRCLIITGAHAAAQSGALDDVRAVLDGRRIEYTVFPGIGANPLVSQCQAAAQAAEYARAQFIVAIGGGSVMDAAKAAAWLANNHIGDVKGLFAASLRHAPLPLVLIGTTAGTGSEVSPAAVLTEDDTGRKRSVTAPQCYARYAFADARYTASCDRATTVSAALDALAHAVEGYLNPGCGSVPAAAAEQAFSLLGDGLAWLAQNDGLPDAALRERLYDGSLWAGITLAALGTAFPHPLGYVLTERYGVPHGMACAVFMRALLLRGEQYAPDRTARLYALCGGREGLWQTLERLVRVDVSMTAADIAALRERFTGVKHYARSPGGFSADEALALYTQLFLK